MQFLEKNISMNIKAIPKGKTHSQYWTKQDFEKVINQIYIDDFYEHLCFVLLWLYFCTGLRVNEGTALWWNNINFDKKQLTVNHMLIMTNKFNWIRQNHTKTDSGLRTISLDDDTIAILKKWKKKAISYWFS